MARSKGRMCLYRGAPMGEVDIDTVGSPGKEGTESVGEDGGEEPGEMSSGGR